MKLFAAFARTLQKELKKRGLTAHITAEAKSGSVYLRFEDPRMGQIRIGDHNERERYGYRWQIRTDITEAYETRAKGHRQFFFPLLNLSAAVKRMAAYQQTIISHGGPHNEKRNTQ